MKIRGFDATVHFDFTGMLAHIQQNPEIDYLELRSAPTGDQVAQLRACLKLAPHVRQAWFFSSLDMHGIEQWLGALPPATLLELRDHELSVAFAAQLSTMQVERLAFHGLQETLVAFVEAHESLAQLTWDLGSVTSLGLEREKLACRLLRTFGRLKSLKFNDGDFSDVMVTWLAEALAQSETLTALDIFTLDSGSLAPLWTSLRDSTTCVLESLTLQRVKEGTSLGEFLASAHARKHLSHLTLGECGRRSASWLLPVIVCNRTGLVALDLSFNVKRGRRDSGLAQKASEKLSRHVELAGARPILSRLRFAVDNVNGLSSQDETLMLAFISVMLCDNQETQSLSCAMGGRAHRVLMPTVVHARSLDLEVGKMEAKELVSALKQNRRLETLQLRGVDELLLDPLAQWLETDAPSSLNKISLTLNIVSSAALRRLLASCASQTLLYLCVQRNDMEGESRNANCAAIVRLLQGAPALQSFTLTGVDFLSDLNAVEVSDAVLAHPSLETTNLVEMTGDAVKAAFAQRRLRRHRLAAHWAQVSVLLGFARNHPRALHGSIVPLLPALAALAGLALPAQGWIEHFMSTACFASRVGLSGRKRKTT